MPRAYVAKRRMSSFLIVEHLDVIEEFLLGLSKRVESFAKLRFERRKPAFHSCIVDAVASSAHADRDRL